MAYVNLPRWRRLTPPPDVAVGLVIAAGTGRTIPPRSTQLAFTVDQKADFAPRHCHGRQDTPRASHHEDRQQHGREGCLPSRRTQDGKIRRSCRNDRRLSGGRYKRTSARSRQPDRVAEPLLTSVTPAKMLSLRPSPP
ncbi:hypothetical protein GCM10010278_65530 [Streptomyces melanogenes]|nr:hypothetical protein GCM10010278_65530 [Streptomyces melanogenes]